MKQIFFSIASWYRTWFPPDPQFISIIFFGPWKSTITGFNGKIIYINGGLFIATIDYQRVTVISVISHRISSFYLSLLDKHQILRVYPMELSHSLP
jgi:hypothetical protein